MVKVIDELDRLEILVSILVGSSINLVLSKLGAEIFEISFHYISIIIGLLFIFLGIVIYTSTDPQVVSIRGAMLGDYARHGKDMGDKYKGQLENAKLSPVMQGIFVAVVSGGLFIFIYNLFT